MTKPLANNIRIWKRPRVAPPAKLKTNFYIFWSWPSNLSEIWLPLTVQLAERKQTHRHAQKNDGTVNITSSANVGGNNRNRRKGTREWLKNKWQMVWKAWCIWKLSYNFMTRGGSSTVLLNFQSAFSQILAKLTLLNQSVFCTHYSTHRCVEYCTDKKSGANMAPPFSHFFGYTPMY